MLKRYRYLYGDIYIVGYYRAEIEVGANTG